MTVAVLASVQLLAFLTPPTPQLGTRLPSRAPLLRACCAQDLCEPPLSPDPEPRPPAPLFESSNIFEPLYEPLAAEPLAEPLFAPDEVAAPIDPHTGLLPAGVELPLEFIPTAPETILPTAAPLEPEQPPAAAAAPPVKVPTLKELAVFCLPTLGIWLSSPLLSLIDTSVVGLTCATHHLAALAPSTKLCDYAAFFCSVVGSATCNLAADAFAKGEKRVAKRTIASSLSISLALGALVAIVLTFFAKSLMLLMLGGGAAAASGPMLAAATDYTTIRALGYPAALLTMTLQSAFIATKDSRTPLLAVPIAGGVNLAADLVLVPGMGAAGAAWATTLSLYTSAATLLAFWARKARGIEEEAPSDAAAAAPAFPLPNNEEGSGAAALYAKPVPLLAMPSKQELKAIVAFAAPMMVALCARVYMGLSITLSAVALGTTALAANQVIESLYWLFCPFGEAISLSMQAYLPPLLLKGRSLARRLQSSAFRAAAMLGAAAAFGGFALPMFAPGIFTTSAAVVAVMQAASPMLGFGLISFVLACATEGMLVARKQLRFLAISHVSTALATALAMRALTRRAGCGLQHVWAAFGVANIVRLAAGAYGLRRENHAAIDEKKRTMTPARWRRAMGALTKRISVLRRQRGEALAEVVPDVALHAPHLLAVDDEELQQEE